MTESKHTHRVRGDTYIEFKPGSVGYQLFAPRGARVWTIRHDQAGEPSYAVDPADLVIPGDCERMVRSDLVYRYAWIDKARIEPIPAGDAVFDEVVEGFAKLRDTPLCATEPPPRRANSASPEDAARRLVSDVIASIGAVPDHELDRLASSATTELQRRLTRARAAVDFALEQLDEDKAIIVRALLR